MAVVWSIYEYVTAHLTTKVFFHILVITKIDHKNFLFIKPTPTQSAVLSFPKFSCEYEWMRIVWMSILTARRCEDLCLPVYRDLAVVPVQRQFHLHTTDDVTNRNIATKNDDIQKNIERSCKERRYVVFIKWPKMHTTISHVEEHG